MLAKIEGELQDGAAGANAVYLNGEVLDPKKSQDVWNKSPDGFSWGYAGSGPAQLALAILLEYTDEGTAVKLFQKFKFEFIAPLKFGQDFYIQVDVEDWIDRQV